MALLSSKLQEPTLKGISRPLPSGSKELASTPGTNQEKSALTPTVDQSYPEAQ